MYKKPSIKPVNVRVHMALVHQTNCSGRNK